MSLLIGFAGPKFCGKTTSAESIKNNPAILSFAAPMKKCLMDLFEFTNEQMYTYEGKEAIDPRYGVSPRTVMQQFGTEFVRKTVPDLWCILMRKAIEGCAIYKIVVIDDIRFENEAALIRDMGGTVVHIRGRGEPGEHESEKQIDVWNRDIILNNCGSLEKLQFDVNKIVGRLREST